MKGLPVLSDGFGLPALEGECPTEHRVGLGVPGPQLHGPGQRDDRLVDLPLIKESHAQIEVEVGKVRLNLQRLAIKPDRLVDLPLMMEPHPD